MVNLPLQCPLCTGMMEIDASLAGQHVTCPVCQQVILAPPLPPEFAEPRPPAPPHAEEYPQLACPVCTGVFQVTPDMAGQQVACPHCQNVVAIPNFEPAPNTFAPPPAEGEAPFLFKPRNFLPTDWNEPPAPIVSPSTSPDMYPPGFSQPVQPTWNPPPEQVWNPEPTAPPVAPPIPYFPPPVYAPEPPPFQPPVYSDPPPPPASELPPPRPKKEKRRNVADMLPPGAADLLPPGASDQPITGLEASPPAAVEQNLAEALLPPGFSPEEQRGLVPGQQQALPTGPIQRPHRGPIPVDGKLVPTPDGGYTTIREKPKTVGKGSSEVEVRQLSEEERAKRRFRRNAILYSICLGVLFLVGYLMTRR